MTDFTILFEMAGYIAVVVVPVILLNRWLADAEGPSLAGMFAIPLDPPWPRGVQEEEPVQWRVERLKPRAAAVERPMPGHAAHPVVEPGPCA